MIGTECLSIGGFTCWGTCFHLKQVRVLKTDLCTSISSSQAEGLWSSCSDVRFRLSMPGMTSWCRLSGKSDAERRSWYSGSVVYQGQESTEAACQRFVLFLFAFLFFSVIIGASLTCVCCIPTAHVASPMLYARNRWHRTDPTCQLSKDHGMFSFQMFSIHGSFEEPLLAETALQGLVLN